MLINIFYYKLTFDTSIIDDHRIYIESTHLRCTRLNPAILAAGCPRRIHAKNVAVPSWITTPPAATPSAQTAVQ